MRKGIKFILFLSSYTPLFIILIIKNINFDKPSIIKKQSFCNFFIYFNYSI